MALERPLKLGTRSSPLALYQANEVKAGLLDAHGWSDDAVEIIPMSTRGDRVQDRPLAEIGGKGLFTAEIEAGLMDGTIDLAVHSMKDVATVLPDGLIISTFLKREDPRDALIAAPGIDSLSDLPDGAIIGTASLRRASQTLAKHPNLVVEPMRGSVQTRLDKIENGVASATYLAYAGLRRLGLADRAVRPLEPSEMLPALCQGIIGIEINADNEALAGALAPLNHGPSETSALCERAMLRRLDGSCRTPIAGLSTLSADGETIYLKGAVFAEDGSAAVFHEASGPADAPEVLGIAVGDVLAEKAKAYPSVIIGAEADKEQG